MARKSRKYCRLYSDLQQRSTEDLTALLRTLLRDIGARVNTTPAADETVRSILRILEERDPAPPLSPEDIAWYTEKREEFERWQSSLSQP